MTPRPGDLPAEPARPNQTANSSNYSAPSPADRPTALPPGGQAWSQDMARDTGPVPTQNPNADKAWWEPRPSGAWAAPGWNATNNPGGAQPGQAGAPGTAGGHGTRSFPAPGRRLRCPRLPEQRLQHRLRQHRHRGPAAGRTAAPRVVARQSSWRPPPRWPSSPASAAGSSAPRSAPAPETPSTARSPSSTPAPPSQIARRHRPVPCRRWPARCCRPPSRCSPAPTRAAVRAPASS